MVGDKNVRVLLVQILGLFGYHILLRGEIRLE